MKKISLLVAFTISTFAFSQFVSPGTGVSYNLASLSAAAPTVLVNNGSDYQMTANVTISAGDTLEMNEDTTLKINGGIEFTVGGNYTTTANNLLITASDPAVIFRGIRFESTANVAINNTTFEYGGGLQVFTGNFVMENSIVRYFKPGMVTGSSVNFSTGNPVVRNSQFIENQLPAVASGANQSVALEFTNNYLYGNTKDNSNRPQINMGPSGSGITKIINNTIIGNRALTRVGGVSVSTLLGIENHPQIEGNTIKDNRYGITVAGNNSSGSISNNIITDNNTETNPLMGGSGIALSGSGSTAMALKIEKNEIRGNLWGITITGTSQGDLGGGSLGSLGQNIFSNNGNGGEIYALNNVSPHAISAENNCWREGELSDDAMVEAIVFHKADDATKGEVDYKPYLCALPLATDNSALLKSKIYPNPSNGTFIFDAEKAGNIVISDMSGRNIHSGIVVKGTNTVTVKAKSGVYILQYISEGKKQSNKLIIK